SGNSNAIRQTEAKLREYGSHSVWISVATYVKCQQTLVKFIIFNHPKTKEVEEKTHTLIQQFLIVSRKYQNG
ncbi:hypothetical protein SAMN05421882_10831, partial [Nitrosomonas communis]